MKQRHSDMNPSPGQRPSGGCVCTKGSNTHKNERARRRTLMPPDQRLRPPFFPPPPPPPLLAARHLLLLPAAAALLPQLAARGRPHVRFMVLGRVERAALVVLEDEAERSELRVACEQRREVVACAHPVADRAEPESRDRRVVARRRDFHFLVAPIFLARGLVVPAVVNLGTQLVGGGAGHVRFERDGALLLPSPFSPHHAYTRRCACAALTARARRPCARRPRPRRTTGAC